MPQAPPPGNVLVLKLSPSHSLDLVRLPDARKYRVVFAERTGVQRRAFVEITVEEAHLLAGFLAWSPEEAAPEEPIHDAATLPHDVEG